MKLNATAKFDRKPSVRRQLRLDAQRLEGAHRRARSARSWPATGPRSRGSSSPHTDGAASVWEGLRGVQPRCAAGAGLPRQHRSALDGRVNEFLSADIIGRCPARLASWSPLHGPEQAAREEPTWQTFDRYLDAVRARRRRSGPARSEAPTPRERARAFAEPWMASSCPAAPTSIPALYGEAPHPDDAGRGGSRRARGRCLAGSARARPARSWASAAGMQAINVFSGGSLVQHVDGHDSPLYPSPEAHAHPCGSRRGPVWPSILGWPTRRRRIEVNSYHHQAVRPDQLGDGLAVGGHHAWTARRSRPSRRRIATTGSSACRSTRNAPSSRRRSSPACGRRSSLCSDRRGG